jgi:outer membrane murein-binding lipoprotein Lpp
MKTKIFAVIAVASLAIVVAGCVSTVAGNKVPAVPLGSDKIEARYERPMEQVFQAAMDVVKFNGTLVHDSTLYNQTNYVDNIAKVVEGKVNQRTVWVRVGQENPKITSVVVQARTSGGTADKDLAAMIDKQIALKLASK